MWRKQDEPKPSVSPADLVVPSVPPPQRSPAMPVATEPAAPAGLVTKAITIKGEITGREDLFIDGEVSGTVRITEGNVTIGPNGRVTADIEAREILVRGKVKGALRGRERVTLGPTGEVAGDVSTRRIVIEEGAVIPGNVDVVRAEEPRAPRAVAAATGTVGPRAVPIRASESAD